MEESQLLVSFMSTQHSNSYSAPQVIHSNKLSDLFHVLKSFSQSLALLEWKGILWPCDTMNFFMSLKKESYICISYPTFSFCWKKNYPG